MKTVGNDPDDHLVARLPVLREVVAGLPATVADPLRRFLDHVGSTVEQEGLGALQVAYVDTFDVTRKCALHLTYFLHGDTRNRGVALVRIKQIYRQHGVELTAPDAVGEELPDFLPVVLEFGATTAPDAAWKLLNDHRVGIELLRRSMLMVNGLYRRPPLSEPDHSGEVMTGTGAAWVSAKVIFFSSEPSAGCGDGAPHTSPAQLGSTIPVGAPR